MFCIKTVRSGERVIIWNLDGSFKIVAGPKIIFSLGKKIEFLKVFSATPNEYIRIEFKDGQINNIKGPSSVWFNPVEHKYIEIKKMLSIEENEALIVYVQKEGFGVQRRIIKGPEIYMPSENEWTHEFRWHGADPVNPSVKIPSNLKFNKLRIIPDQMYFDVQDVRTSDDALVVIKIMIFFELRDINQMLSQTHDPIADFINALTADIIDFVSNLTFEQFKESTERLNNLETYKQLIIRTERIGYQINKVVYRGYTTNQRLQEMHNIAIEARTKLKLEAETETQAQELADLKLQREIKRSQKRREMEENEILHKNNLLKLEHEEKLRQAKAETDIKLDELRNRNKISIENKQEVNKEDEAFLATIKTMNVDLTKYLIAQYQPADKLIKIDAAQKPQLHIHD